MFPMGDEFGNTQFGNNNPYCQDNEISWLDWTLLDKNREIFDFFKYMISFRKKHAVIRGTTAHCSCYFPDVSFHGAEPWNVDYSRESRLIGVMFSGKDKKGNDDIVMVITNAHWDGRDVALPALPSTLRWKLEADTGLGRDAIPRKGYSLPEVDKYIRMKGRSVAVLSAIGIFNH
jgi:glycogen operon protein